MWNLGFIFSPQEKQIIIRLFFDFVCTESSVTEDHHGDARGARSTEHISSDVRLFSLSLSLGSQLLSNFMVLFLLPLLGEMFNLS